MVTYTDLITRIQDVNSTRLCGLSDESLNGRRVSIMYRDSSKPKNVLVFLPIVTYKDAVLCKHLSLIHISEPTRPY